MERKGRRRPWLAGLGNLLFPGLGFLYLGRVWFALLMPLAVLLMVAVMAWTRLIMDPAGVVLMLVFYLLLWLGGTVAAVVMARRAGVVVLGAMQRGVFYAGFAALSIAINLSVTADRATLFGFEPYHVQSVSMAGTLIRGDMVLVDRWAYQGSLPQRGDVVMFQPPEKAEVRYLKRVIGVPGDAIVMTGKTVSVNGEQLDEPYSVFDDGLPPYWRRGGSYMVPPGHYFVLGDNRDHSADSRYFGYVEKEAIEARVAFIFFSRDEEGVVRSERIGQRVE